MKWKVFARCVLWLAEPSLISDARTGEHAARRVNWCSSGW